MTNSAPDEARTATHYRKVTFKAHGNSWVLACVDGRKLFERLFQNGDSAELPFSSQALLHSGNAGALEIEIDSSPVGSMGETGAARTWQFSGNGGGVDISTKYHHTCDTY